ncbi:MAG: hypothetical protein K9J79_09800, partial [Desulfobacteraceae bacterium]|nr:hypothetical protein [Desulfobacteraceae bacterium]
MNPKRRRSGHFKIRPVAENSKNSRILLFFPFRRLPAHAEEIIERLSAASGIASEDLRYKLVGRGLARLTPGVDAEKQEACLAEMRDIGIPATLVTSETARRRLKLPLAKSVEISENSIIFFDRNDQAVFTVDEKTDLLVIAADLSGKTTEKAHLALQFNTYPGPGNFNEALKKISLSKPAAVFARTDGGAPLGVFVDHCAFAYPSLKNHMSMSASVNFRTLVAKTIERAKTAVTDHEFGSASLAGAMPDW